MLNGIPRGLTAGVMALAGISGSAHGQRAPPRRQTCPRALCRRAGTSTYNVCRGTDPKCYSGWIGTRQNGF
jgi:hypothetical protein